MPAASIPRVRTPEDAATRVAEPPVLLTPRLIGDVNRSRIMRALREHGPRTRADLARLADVPRATIGKITATMIDVGLLVELAPDRSEPRVGKPGRPLWFGPRSGLCVGVAFGADGIRAALVNARGDVLRDAVVEIATAEASPTALVDAVRRAVTEASSRARGVLGIGIAVPGVCDSTTGEVIGSGQLPGAEGRGLVDGLADLARVVVDNDARAQALAEKWFGVGRGVATFASLQTGEGLGVGLVVDGSLHRGQGGRGGELGHTRVTDDGQCRCGLVGCWETIATLRWLRAEARDAGLPRPAKTTAASLTALAGRDQRAAALLDRYADNLARGLSTLVNLLEMRFFVLHGDVVGGGEQLRQRIETATRRSSLPLLRDEVQITLSELDTDATVLGAASLVLSEVFAIAA